MFQIRVYNRQQLINEDRRDLSVTKVIWSQNQQGTYPLTICLRDEEILEVKGLSLTEIGNLLKRKNVKVLSSKKDTFIYRQLSRYTKVFNNSDELQAYLLSFDLVKMRFENRIK